MPRLLLCLCLLNITVVFALSKVYSLEPSASLRLTSRSEAVIVYGYNSLGFLSVRCFQNVDGAKAWLSERGLRLPMISYAGLGLNHDSTQIKGQKQRFKVLWGKGSFKHILETPDMKSAKLLAEYVRYHGLKPSSLGFSLDVEKN